MLIMKGHRVVMTFEAFYEGTLYNMNTNCKVLRLSNLTRADSSFHIADRRYTFLSRSGLFIQQLYLVI
jgi:hypothetical protein